MSDPLLVRVRFLINLLSTDSCKHFLCRSVWQYTTGTWTKLAPAGTASAVAVGRDGSKWLISADGFSVLEYMGAVANPAWKAYDAPAAVQIAVWAGSPIIVDKTKVVRVMDKATGDWTVRTPCVGLGMLRMHARI